jgi:S1-C subfamily serine protease
MIRRNNSFSFFHKCGWKIAATICSALLLASAPAAERDIRRDATVDAVEKVMPSVVNIRTETIVESRDPFEDLFRQFFDPYHRRQESEFSLGSGVIIDEDGYILTNLHVVRRARRIQIKLSDEAGGGEYEVQPIIGTSKTDVALLKIIPKKKGEKFKAVKFAKDDDLMLGETVIALGNPFGLGGSVSRGILSAKRRAVPKEDEPLNVQNWIQTDAAINPGNSGGPLVNLNGDLIGLNVAILAEGQGIGFAIPVKQVSEALSEIFTPETDARWLGVRVQPGSSPLAITGVDKGSPAEQAGLHVGDKILEVNGKAPKGFIELNQWLRDNSQSKFAFEVQRGSARHEVSVQVIPFERLLRERLGLDAQELREDLAASFGLKPLIGLLVSGVEKNGPADRVGLAAGMVITEINGKTVPDFLNAMARISDLRKGDPAKLTLLVPQRRGNYFLGYQPATVTLKTR